MILVLLIVVMTACSDNKPHSSSVQEAEKYDDLTALTVYVNDGKVTEVYRVWKELFWDGDMPYLEEQNGKKVWKPVPGALHKRWEEYEA